MKKKYNLIGTEAIRRGSDKYHIFTVEVIYIKQWYEKLFGIKQRKSEQQEFITQRGLTWYTFPEFGRISFMDKIESVLKCFWEHEKFHNGLTDQYDDFLKEHHARMDKFKNSLNKLTKKARDITEKKDNNNSGFGGYN